MDDHVRSIVIAGLSEVNFVAYPRGGALRSIMRVGVIRRINPRASGREFSWRAPAHATCVNNILLFPYLTQDLKSRQRLDRFGRCLHVHPQEDQLAIRTDLFSIAPSCFLTFRQTILLDPATVAVKPVDGNTLPQPVGGARC